MRRTVAIIGVIMLLIGVMSVATSIFGGGISSLENRIDTFTQPKAGEYVSTELVLSGVSIVAVASPATVGGMIPSQDLNQIDSANVGTYAVPYTRSIGNAETYNDLTGDYYYVVFSSSQPNTQIIVTNASSARGLVAVGLTILAGVVLFIVGIIVAIIGVFLKNPRKDSRAVI